MEGHEFLDLGRRSKPMTAVRWELMEMKHREEKVPAQDKEAECSNKPEEHK